MKLRVSFLGMTGCVAVVLLTALLVFQCITKTEFADVAANRPSSAASKSPRAPGHGQAPNWREAYARLPLAFEANEGQAAREVQFLSRGSGYQLLLTSQGADVSLQSGRRVDLSPRNRTKFLRSFSRARRAARISVIRLRLDHANPASQIAGLDRLPGRADYFIGSDPKNWKTGIPSYSRVKYCDIYPGVDLMFYGNQRRLEYDFVVAPGTDPKIIQLRIEGAQELRLTSKGSLLLGVPGGELEFEKPVVYQAINEKKTEVASRYVLLGKSRVGFEVSEYDRTQPLVMDPILNYSTYLGGTGDENVAEGIAVDSHGHAFVGGTTFSTDFPTTASAFKAAPPASTPAVFLSEFDPTGTSLLYSTYLGGSAGDFGFGVGVDSTGNVYVTGEALSTDFPTTANAMIPSPLASNPNGTAFISKINPGVSGVGSLVYSSYFGGTNGDFGNSVAADSNQVAYITGLTISAPGALGTGGFTTKNAFQAGLIDATDGNAFVAAIDTTQAGAAGLKYSTYLGGDGANAGTANLLFGDQGFGIATDGVGGAFVAGTTTSDNFPASAGAFQKLPPAGNILGAAFVTNLDTTASGNASLVYSTYLGGATSDFGNAIALGPSHVAYTTGSTSSANFPITSGNISAPSAAGVAFVSLIDTSKSGAASLPYSTLLGGSGGDIGFAVQADVANGFAFVAGGTSSADFPVTPGAFQPTLATGAPGDAFIAKINPNPAGSAATNLLYATYFGGSGASSTPDTAIAIAIDAADSVYVAGDTSSTDLPLAPAAPFQSSLKGSSDAFVAKLPLVPTVSVSPPSISFGTQVIGGTTPAQFVTMTNNTDSAVAISSIAVVPISGPATDFPIGPNSCGNSLAAESQCTVGVAYKPSVAAAESSNLVFSFTDPVTGKPAQLQVDLSGTGSGAGAAASFSPTSLQPFAGQLVTTTSTPPQMVTMTNTGTATLMNIAISTSGDFGQTNTCGASLNVGANCTISVTFTPTKVGPRSGTLTITDNAANSPQQLPLSGTGWDFGISAPASENVTRPNTLNFKATMTPLGGFTGTVALSLSGCPVHTTCAISPNSVSAADGVTPQTPAVSIITTGEIVPLTKDPNPPVTIPIAVLLLISAAIYLMPRIQRRLRTGMALAGVILAFLLFVGCGGGHPGTPTGPFTLTITGTSSTVTHTTTVSITVQ